MEEVPLSEGVVDSGTDEPSLLDAEDSETEAPFGVLMESGTGANLESVVDPSGGGFEAMLEVAATSGRETTCEAAAEPGMEATVEVAAESAGSSEMVRPDGSAGTVDS